MSYPDYLAKTYGPELQQRYLKLLDSPDYLENGQRSCSRKSLVRSENGAREDILAAVSETPLTAQQLLYRIADTSLNTLQRHLRLYSRLGLIDCSRRLATGIGAPRMTHFYSRKKL